MNKISDLIKRSLKRIVKVIALAKRKNFQKNQIIEWLLTLNLNMALSYQQLLSQYSLKLVHTYIKVKINSHNMTNCILFYEVIHFLN